MLEKIAFKHGLLTCAIRGYNSKPLFTSIDSIETIKINVHELDGASSSLDKRELVQKFDSQVDSIWKGRQFKPYRPRVTWKNGGLLDPEIAPYLFRKSDDQVNLSVEGLTEFYMNYT